MRRMVACPSEDGNDGIECNKADRPVDRIACNTDPCPAWNTGGWSEVGTGFMVTSKTQFLNFPVLFFLTVFLNCLCFLIVTFLIISLSCVYLLRIITGRNNFFSVGKGLKLFLNFLLCIFYTKLIKCNEEIVFICLYLCFCFIFTIHIF